MEQNNDEIRMLAQRSLMLQKVTEASIKQSNNALVSNYLSLLKDLAEQVYTLSEDGVKDGLVVYVNTTSFILRTTSDMGQIKEALAYAVLALEKSMKVLEKIEKQEDNDLPDEMRCNFKTMQLFQINTLFDELCSIRSDGHFLGEKMHIIAPFYSLFSLCYEELVMVTGSSMFTMMMSDTYRYIQDFDLIRYPYKTASPLDIARWAEQISAELEDWNLVNTDPDPHSNLLRYEDLYYGYWFKEAFKMMMKVNCCTLERIFEPYFQSLHFNAENMDIGSANIYSTENFRWSNYPECIFEEYRLLCDKYGLTPLDFPDYTPDKKLLYVRPQDLLKMHREVVTAYLHLRDYDICNLGTITDEPDFDEILDYAEKEDLDEDYANFLVDVVCFCYEMEGNSIQLEKLSLCYTGYLQYQEQNDNPDISKEELIQEFEEELDPLTTGLKEMGAIPQDWTFDINKLY